MDPGSFLNLLPFWVQIVLLGVLLPIFVVRACFDVLFARERYLQQKSRTGHVSPSSNETGHSATVSSTNEMQEQQPEKDVVS